MIRKAVAALSLLMVNAALAQVQQPPGTVLSAPGGRFVFGQISGGRVDQYMLDTQTGRVWQLQCLKRTADGFGCESAMFTPMPFQWPAGSPDSFGFTPTWVPPAIAPSPPPSPKK